MLTPEQEAALDDETRAELQRLRSSLKTLQDRQNQLLESSRPKNLREIGERLGISPERARQIEWRALRKLRDRAPDLRDILTR